MFLLLTRSSPFLLHRQLWEMGQLWLYNSGRAQPDGLQMQPPHLLRRADGGSHLPTAPYIFPTGCSSSPCLVFPSPQVSSPEITYIHRDYLSIITYIGCLISALASICTIFFLYFRYGLTGHPTLPVCVLSIATTPGWAQALQMQFVAWLEA